jgi:flagellar protein FlaF
MFVAFGMFHSATANGFETVSDAQEDRTDRTLTQQNTAIVVTAATWDDTSGELTVTANNTGSSQLSVEEVDLLADNRYLQDYETTVDGEATTTSDSSTALWLPGERLTITVTTLESDPGRIKLVTGPGVAETKRTEVA